MFLMWQNILWREVKNTKKQKENKVLTQQKRLFFQKQSRIDPMFDHTWG